MDAPPGEWEAADALMESQFRRLSSVSEGAIDEAVKQVGLRQQQRTASPPCLPF